MSLSSTSRHQQQFDEFYKENYRWLHHWLCKTLRSHANVEDILQDTFLKILVAPHLIEQIKQPRPYLVTTARNIIINQARRKKIEEEYIKILSEQAEEFDHSPEHMVLVIETLHLVANALSSLEKRHQQVLIMHYIDGISQVDLAKHFNVCRKTIQNDLMKAIIGCHRNIQKNT